MITKFEIVKGHREYTYPLKKDIEYCVSGSGTFTVEVLHGGKEVYGVVLRENYIQLPKFNEDCQLKVRGRDMMAFTIYLSDASIPERG
jgi:hypothetical protein